MPAKPELVYFDITGRGEPVRLMLHMANVDFTDTRIPFSEWPKVKPTTPLGSVPVLKLDGKTYCQSMALVRYAAKLGGLYPTDPLEALVVDQMLDTVSEIAGKAPRADDEEEKKKLRKEWQNGQLTQYAKFIESVISETTGNTVLSSGLSAADVGIMTMVKSVQDGLWDYVDKDFFDQFPVIMKTTKAVVDHPKVKSFYKK